MLRSCLEPILNQFRASNFVNMTLYDPYNNTELELDYSLFVFFAQICNKGSKNILLYADKIRIFFFFWFRRKPDLCVPFWIWREKKTCVYAPEYAAKNRSVSTLSESAEKPIYVYLSKSPANQTCFYLYAPTVSPFPTWHYLFSKAYHPFAGYVKPEYFLDNFFDIIII